MLYKRLKQARIAKKLTQEQLAKMVNTKKSTISNYENEYSTPSNEMLYDLANALEVTSDYLLGRVDSPQGFKVDYSKVMEPETSPSTTKDEIDIAKRMDQIRKDLSSEDGLLFNGEPMSEEAIESFIEAMEVAVRQTQRINKKYIPKKYRKDENI